MGSNSTMCQDLNIWDALWTNQVQMRQCCKVVSERIDACAKLGLWLMLGV